VGRSKLPDQPPEPSESAPVPDLPTFIDVQGVQLGVIPEQRREPILDQPADVGGTEPGSQRRKQVQSDDHIPEGAQTHDQNSQARPRIRNGMEKTAMRLLMPILVLLLVPAALAQAEGDTEEAQKQKTEKAKQALNRAFKGRVIKIKKKTVTLYYDFEDEDQLKDFEDVRPPRLLDLGTPSFAIRGGRLFIDGSTAVRHRMEGSGRVHAQFFLKAGMQKNIGTIFTEPVVSDFFTVLNLFDQRFYRNGGLLLAACGLHEDEGAADDMALVNWRDIVKGDVRKQVKVGQDVEIEVAKDGWTEYCRVGKFESKGSSKGKGKDMKAYQFGIWCDHSSMSIDDLTITLTLTDEFLDLNDLKAEIDIVWEEIPAAGPLKGLQGVPPRLAKQVDAYAAKETRDAGPLADALDRSGLDKKVREAVCKVLIERGDPKIVPLVMNGLYSEDKLSRQYAINVIKAVTGKTWGLSAGGGEKARRAAIQKLNQHLNENRQRYFDS
jgi:hypothetical protein